MAVQETLGFVETCLSIASSVVIVAAGKYAYDRLLKRNTIVLEFVRSPEWTYKPQTSPRKLIRLYQEVIRHPERLDSLSIQVKYKQSLATRNDFAGSVAFALECHKWNLKEIQIKRWFRLLSSVEFLAGAVEAHIPVREFETLMPDFFNRYLMAPSSICGGTDEIYLGISNLQEPPYTTKIRLSKFEFSLFPDPLKLRIDGWVNVRLNELEKYCPSIIVRAMCETVHSLSCNDSLWDPTGLSIKDEYQDIVKSLTIAHLWEVGIA